MNTSPNTNSYYEPKKITNDKYRKNLSEKQAYTKARNKLNSQNRLPTKLYSKD